MHSCRNKFCGNVFEATPYIYWTNVSIAMHNTNTVQENPTLVMYDSNTFFYVVSHFLMALVIS